MSDYGYHCALPAGLQQLIIGAVEDNLGEILVDEGKILVVEAPMKKEDHQLPQKPLPHPLQRLGPGPRPLQRLGPGHQQLNSLLA